MPWCTKMDLIMLAVAIVAGVITIVVERNKKEK